jgi:NAD(P)-dependent dehydrogenase (short-subunit alcohol dehydrogenase family)
MLTAAEEPRQVYVVLGATGGIGASLVRRLAAAGAQVVLGARASDRLGKLAEEVDGLPFPLDAEHFEQVDACVQFAVDKFGRIDGVANCVGSLLLKAAHQTSAAEWQATVAANLSTAFATVRSGAKAMQKSGGSIVLVSSAAASVGLANHEAIAAAKAGVVGLMLSAAATYAHRGVRVNCVAPGLVATPLTTRITGNAASLAASTAMHPLGRIGDPADVAAAIEWLLRPEQRWVTGQNIGVDGGLANLRAR